LNCPHSDQYINSAGTAEGLEDILKEAFEDIQTSFRCRVDYGVPASELSDSRYRFSNPDVTRLFIRNPRTGIGRFIEGTKRAYILNNDEWMATQKLTMGPQYAGVYCYPPAVILLHSNGNAPNSWCKNVLIHETLHSVSLYSRIWDNPSGIIARHKMLIEGITECLAGYVLLKKHLDCYDVWKLSAQGNCAIGYRPSTKLFCSLAQVIGIDPLADFYLSWEREFNAPWNKLLEAIHSIGYTKFKYTLDDHTAFRENLLRDECVKFINGFKKIYDSDARALDFSQIP
jgi:hypothetical protein